MTSTIVCYDADLKPVYPDTCGEQYIADLGIFDGKRYLALSEGVVFAKQAKGISVKKADLSNADLLKYIKTESLPARQIDEETQRKIRERYSLEEELKALRTKDEEYEAYVAEVVANGRARKEVLGLLIKSEVAE